MKEKTISPIKASDMIKCSLFAALIVIGTYIKIPLYVVPFTLQFLFTNLAGLLLGKRLGMLSVALYIILGLIGLPVFTGGGGIAYVLSPSFGYIIGFMIGAYVAGYLSENLNMKPLWRYFIAGLINLLIVYVLGVLYYYLIAKFYIGPIPLTKLIWGGAIIFIPVDTTLCLISALIAMRLTPMIKRNG